jgi:hypothetical protein
MMEALRSAFGVDIPTHEKILVKVQKANVAANANSNVSSV